MDAKQRAEMEELRAAKRTEVQKIALQASLLDAVFAIIQYDEFDRRFGPPPQPHPIDLVYVKHRFCENEIQIAREKVAALRKESYRSGDDLRNRIVTGVEVLERLRQSHPGFSDRSYNAVIDQGYFESR